MKNKSQYNSGQNQSYRGVELSHILFNYDEENEKEILENLDKIAELHQQKALQDAQDEKAQQKRADKERLEARMEAQIKQKLGYNSKDSK